MVQLTLWDLVCVAGVLLAVSGCFAVHYGLGLAMLGLAVAGLGVLGGKVWPVSSKPSGTAEPPPPTR